QGTLGAKRFEIARVFLGSAADPPQPPLSKGGSAPAAPPITKGGPGGVESEPILLALISGGSFADVKGVVTALARRINPGAALSVRPADVPQFAAGRGAEVRLDGELWGWLGELDREVTDRLDLRDAVTAAELDMGVLERAAQLTPIFEPLPQYPAVTRDMNFVLDEAVTWQRLVEVIASVAGPLLETVEFGGQYRGKQIPADRKSYVATLVYRAADRTLTSEEVESAQGPVVEACERELGAALRA
ncbi:MAG: hypothetical protein KY476_25230, partial [Planctomycetes bacterium]|nr:hypothetical protein [Planctomycetota bacterium]